MALFSQLVDLFYSEQFCFYRNIAAVVGIVLVLRLLLKQVCQLSGGFCAFFLAPWGISRINLKKYGPWAVVTGASEGIGRGYALELARQGLNVVIMSRSQDKLQKVADEIKEKYGREVRIIAADFSDGPELYPRIAEELQDLDIGLLVNNVGYGLQYPEYFGEVPEEWHYKTVQLNCHPVVQMTRMLLPKMVVKRRGVVVNISSGAADHPLQMNGVYSATKDELRSSGSSLGYRAMWKRLQQKYHIVVPRDLVMRMLFQLDPEGCFERKYKKLRRRKYRNQGPNYTWHCDGYDKLKPYGFPIHGCIDGYSRRILWLKVGTTNNNPAVIAHYFLTCVNELGGTPRILRCDLGTENTHVAFLQPFLRRNGTDCFSGEHSFRYGKSVSNQRIEAWWSHLKRCFTGWWIELFQGMQFSGLYDETNCIHRDCLQFCFMHIIQRELDAVVREWNTHRIRPSKDCLVPAGIPDELFFLPQVQGTVSYLCATNRQDLHATQRYEEVPDPPGSLSFLQMVNELMTEHQFHFPHTIEEAMCLYAELVVLIEAENH